MSNVEITIGKLDRQLRAIEKEQSIVNKTGKTGLLENPLLSEYLRLTTTDAIVPGIQYIALDALAKHFNLYEDGERQQILAAMGDDLNDSSNSEVVASLQIVENIYPSIYSLGQEQFSITKERALRSMTGLSIPTSQVNNSQLPTISAPETKQPETVSRPPATTPNNSALLVGMGIVCAVMFGALVASNVNKSPAGNSGVASNNTSTANTSVASNNTSTANTSQTNTPSSTQTSTPLPTPRSSISKEAALEVVKQWIQYKKVLFAPPYDTSQGSTLLTGKAYINNIDRSSEPCNNSGSEGCLSSVDWLKRYNAQYSFSVQRVDSIDKFEASEENASIFVTVTEYRTLYNKGKSTPSGGTKQYRYDLKYENGRAKISDYKVL
jgi:ARC6-like, IMS domain